jgi:hypothetical protein
MAIRNVYVSGLNGIGYTAEVDSSGDYGSVSNDMYFKDLSKGVGGLIFYKGTTGEIYPIFATNSSGGSGGSGGGTYSAGMGLTLSAGNTFSVSMPNNKIIWVSNYGGSDTNSGLSELSPVQTILRGRDLAGSGDTVVVMPGTYSYDNRYSAGYPYGAGGTVAIDLNLWKDGVTYHFMPGAKIYAYNSTNGYPGGGGTDLLFFRPNLSAYSVCSVTGHLEFYASSEGADNSYGNVVFFNGQESNGLSTYPGYTFNLQASIIECITGGTPFIISRTNLGQSAAYVNIDIRTIRYTYTTGQSASGVMFMMFGSPTSETVINISSENIINVGGLVVSCQIFQTRFGNFSTSEPNLLRVNIRSRYCSMDRSFLIKLDQTPSTTPSLSTSYINLHIDECIFNFTAILVLQVINARINISGNYYCSGTKKALLGWSTLTPQDSEFMQLFDSVSDGRPDYGYVNFTGNYYANHPSRSIASISSGHRLTFDGDVFFNGPTQSYTGNLFVVGRPASAALYDSLVFQGTLHGMADYTGLGFKGTMISYYNVLSNVVIDRSLIMSNMDSYLFSGGTGDLRIQNSSIVMYATASALASAQGTNVYVENSSIRNTGTSEIFYNSLSSGRIQILNSSLMIAGASTASTIQYAGASVSAFGVVSNREIAAGMLLGTVSVASYLV